MPQAADDTAMRLVELYSHRDPALGQALSQGLQLEKAASGNDMKPQPGGNAIDVPVRAGERLAQP